MKRLINKCFVEQNDNVFLQMFRYGCYGLITVSVCFLVLYFFTEIVGWHYLISNVLSFFVGLPVNYFLCKKFIFSTDIKNRKIEFVLYGVFSGIGLLIDSGVLYLLTDENLGNIYYLISKIFSSIVVFLWNFGSRKLMYVMYKLKRNI